MKKTSMLAAATLSLAALFGAMPAPAQYGNSRRPAIQQAANKTKAGPGRVGAKGAKVHRSSFFSRHSGVSASRFENDRNRYCEVAGAYRNKRKLLGTRG